MTEYTCELCGCELHEDDLQVFDDTTLCPDCLEERTVICESCGERIWDEDNAGNDALYLCQHCYDHQYTTCEDCGCILSYDETFDSDDGSGPYCCRCHNRHQKNHTIQNYYYKPSPVFFGDGPRFFGVELELDLGGEDADRAARILALGTIQGRIGMYAKHDSSLDDGFELVTHPLSYDCHMNEFPWADILQEARRLGYRSHQARTCGLHVHVSRKAFGTTTAQQDAGIARVLYFVERNWEELMTFSRRTPSQMDQWAARYGLKNQPQEILNHAKTGCHNGRYTCVNLENHDTIEFRMFRGTLKLNTLLATLQLVNRICDLAVLLTDQEMKELSWLTFLSGCKQPELIQYLKERRLYINDSIHTEEEV